MHILIVGAGLAGLTCARMLDRWKIPVSIVEASDGVGGRVRSDRQDGYIFDRGFQVLFDAYPAVQRQLDLQALDLRAFDPGAIICLRGRQEVLADPLRDSDLSARIEAALSPVIGPRDKLRAVQLALELRGQTIDEMLQGEDESSYDFLRRRGFSDRAIDLFFRPFYGGVFFDRALTTSAKCLKFDFKMLADGRACLPSGGMGAIADQLAAPLLARGLVRTNAAVSTLLTDGAQVVGARLADDQEIRADAVVVATPAPVAARLTGLPTPGGARQTVCLYYAGDRPIYQSKKLALNPAPDAFVNNAQLLTNVAPSYAPPGKHLLGATVIGIAEMSDTDLLKRGLRDLHHMFAGDPAAQAALAGYQPLRLYRIPYAQFDQPPGVHPRLPDNRGGRPGLYFAAEWTEASSLNAAMISGEKCAAAVVEDNLGRDTSAQ
ncbi:MAG TPA: NAD(P)/FAD-dependent oxidoreductase [Roseiflexaceae bacterium]|nr:NAD(P)/FAD-dependent oxidoreductase [Roseiflexaceae bacterium]